MSDVLIARESFYTEAFDIPRTVIKGETFDAGNEVAVAHPDLFRPWNPDNGGERVVADEDEATVTGGRRRSTVK